MFAVIFFPSCKQDILEIAKMPNSSHNVVNISDDDITQRTSNQTVLGSTRTNPFTIQNMIAAHHSLYQSSITSLPTTDIYIKFTPSAPQHLLALEESGEEFYDYPLDREVISMGDYYQDIDSNDYPILYAVIKPNFVIPDVPYEILANMYINHKDPLLMAESFYLTGQAGDIDSYIVGSGLTKADLDPGVQAMIPQEPDCPSGEHAVLYIDKSSRPYVYEWRCEPNDPGGTIQNACGCSIQGNRRFPSGCIRVEDTELSTSGNPNTFLPVRQVKVIAKDTWFTEDETWTSQSGCWEIARAYRGNAWVWIKFKNDKFRIRGAEKEWKGIWQWITTKKSYIGKFEGPDFSNIQVNLNMWSVQGYETHMLWGAATVNNALLEFHTYAGQDGILAPPDGLDIYIGRNHRYGYTLMGSQHYLSEAAFVLFMNSAWFIGPWGFLVGAIGYAGTALYISEVYIGINFHNSDQLKSLAYHELAHASHCRKVGGRTYWDRLVEAEILAGGHGDENSSDAGLIALCESWAEYIGGHVYVDRTYGEVNSIFEPTWEDRLEKTWNESTNHIPVGLYHDLVDDGIEPLSCNQRGSGCTNVTDQVIGFSNAQMYSCLIPTTFTVEQFQSLLINNYLSSTGNTADHVNDLFNSY